MKRLEQIILSNLIFNDEYLRKTIPFLKTEYFKENVEKNVFDLISSFVEKYKAPPTKETLLIELDKTKLKEHHYNECVSYIEELTFEKKNNDWLIENTENFCQESAVYNAIMSSIDIIEGTDSILTKGSIPSILSDALSVSFDRYIGHDFIENAEERFDFYRRKEEKIEFDLDFFNKITQGGFSKKTLNVFLAGTGVGKTLLMCHMAAANLKASRNVLYITLEMAEERIAERIDANILDVDLDELKKVPKETYINRITKLKNKTNGKLIIKEYPTASVHSGHFRHLINELKLKKDFTPDIIYIDYINLCLSARTKFGANMNSYNFIKMIAEELRGLAVEMNVPIVSATQLNREGFTNSDPGLENTSESFGLPATVDFMCVILSTEELEKLNQFMIKQLKNRYEDLNKWKRFVIGVEKSKMKLYDIDENVQRTAVMDDSDDRPVMDNSNFGERYNEEETMKFMTKKAGRKKFDSLFT
jgi:replicative DNA helicase